MRAEGKIELAIYCITLKSALWNMARAKAVMKSETRR
jgi:hypothetical protein